MNARCRRDPPLVKSSRRFGGSGQGAEKPAASANVDAHTKYAARLTSIVSGMRMSRGLPTASTVR
jgi:hypothetical protein